MTWPKFMLGKWRIIMDLSFTPGASVNAGIPRREYLGVRQSYRVPSVAELGARLVGQGRSAYIWERHPLSAPARQARVGDRVRLLLDRWGSIL